MSFRSKVTKHKKSPGLAGASASRFFRVNELARFRRHDIPYGDMCGAIWNSPINLFCATEPVVRDRPAALVIMKVEKGDAAGRKRLCRFFTRSIGSMSALGP